jgi:ribonuclease P protein component
MRFRREQHLRRQSDIRAARQDGSRVDCQAYTIWWRRRPEPGAASSPLPLTLPRVGVVASFASVGGAVRRNRAKRRLREIFRRNQHLLPPDCDLLLIARPGVIQRSFPELEKKFVESCRIVSASGWSKGRHE